MTYVTHNFDKTRFTAKKKKKQEGYAEFKVKQKSQFVPHLRNHVKHNSDHTILTGKKQLI